jgi:hypothetical protein
VARGESCTISCVASDADGDSLSYDWTATGGTITGEGSTISWIAPSAEGDYIIAVTVSDGKGGTASDSCTIPVANAPPQISSLNPSTTSVALEGSCTITCTASDADGDSLNYDWTATVGTITGEGSTITWIAPSAEGDYIIAVTVSDGKGGTVSDTCEITVEMKFGSIDIQSSPTGATIYLNGADTGNTTPYVIANLMTGTYTVKLVYYHYIDREETVTVAANETTYLNSSLTYASEKTLTIQPSATTGKDAGVDKFESTKNYGDHTALAAGAYGYTTNRSYLQFNLDSLPEGAVITSAALGLYYLYNEPGEPSEIGVYQVYQDWTEIGITWNSQPMFNIRPKCVLTLPTSPTNSFVHWDITELVRKWHDNLQYNFGVMLKSTDESVKEAWIGFYSSDWGDPIQRPKLVVTYFDSTP